MVGLLASGFVMGQKLNDTPVALKIAKVLFKKQNLETLLTLKQLSFGLMICQILQDGW